MPNVISFYKDVTADSRRMLKKNQQIINVYNVHVLKILLAITTVCLLFLTLLAYLPSLDYFYHLKYQILFASSFVVMFAFLLVCLVFQDFVGEHTVPFLYAYIVLISAFSIMINLINFSQAPYVITVALMVIVPMMMMDVSFRIIMFEIALLVASLYLSYYFKETSFFIMDVANCTLFTVVGIVLGNVTRSNYIGYIDLKEHELDRNVEVLKAKNEAKSSFLANMSHEIRTPINAVLGLNEMILRESTERNVLTYANDIKSAGRTLVSIINDVLDFSKIEANKLTLTPTEYKLDSVVSDIINMISPRAAERGLKLRITVPEDTPNVLFGDDIRIKQCITNLLTNAVKYTNEGYVDLIIEWERINTSPAVLLRVRVRDTGTGIKTENLTKLFSAFERIDEQMYRTTEGTGLGLTITQRLLEKMDSKLHVESEYGKGSEFWFEIHQGIIKDTPIGNFDDRFAEYERKTANYRETFHAPDARILVVDDMKVNLDVIAGLLKRTRVQIDTALSGAEALRQVSKHKYHLIFLDHRMPEMDGIETLHAMKTQADNLSIDTPCVALTANAISGAREMYLKEGFVDYIAKPVDYIKLEELLVAHLPKELMKRVNFNDDAGDYENQPAERDPFMNEYYKVEGINASAALDFCGDMEVLKGAVRDFFEGIDNQANLIEKYCYQKDVKNYLILVHGLKSSARLIGAEELSKGAAYLEQCAKDNKIDEIEANTPDLLEIFRGFKFKLARLLVEAAVPGAPQEPIAESAQESAPQVPPPQDKTEQVEIDAQKPRQDMDGDQFGGALEALAECIAADDFGAAQNIVQMVEAYNLPLEAGERFSDIKKAIFAADKDTALHLLRQ